MASVRNHAANIKAIVAAQDSDRIVARTQADRGPHRALRATLRPQDQKAEGLGMSYPLSVLSEFDYRKAQTARGCRPRNLKAKEDLMRWIRHISYQFLDSDWMFGLHDLDIKRLREFAVYVDWSLGRGPSRLDRDEGAHKYETDHLYAFLKADRHEWTELERLWLQALDVHGALGGYPVGTGHDAPRRTPRPGVYLSKVGVVPSEKPSWPSLLVASFWEPQVMFDTSYLTSIQQSPALAAIRRRYSTSTELWIVLVDGQLQIQLPFDSSPK
jgi:hypothetical protein